ncbi:MULTISPECIES: branched-chain amino acid ABC transporter permease [unclassified Halomonas]|uniref:branched-chain amino acid ABC transporter permease n=1 Tax=Halomonas sp. Ps84H-12 TaxID=2954501 RepID=UPI0020985E7A|nr:MULTISPECIES: branched-chain amino acid ABC transporter permease [unclassified Halomonas]MCO7241681.1 branched-chain amino acid ABC transporter permease [Halomonas sp. Ps84H-12]|tara:strand:- start:5328 stop:6392 length:1065 start_codon:yes stop_codon:yes gene_type:complete
MLHRYPKRVAYIMLALTALVATFPLWGVAVFGSQANFMLEKLTLMLILALFAMSLDLLVGIVGLVSLGHALFFGLGAYTLALASPDFSPASMWWMLPLVIGVSACVGLIVGILVIRTKGIFFIMTTLAFGQMLYYFISTSQFAGGTDGVFIMFRPSLAIGDTTLVDLDNPYSFFYFCLGMLLVGYLFLRWLTRSYFGQVLDGIHDNEHRMQALGYATSGYKLIAFVIAGVMAAIAGMLAAMQYGFANPAQLGWHTSGEVLMMLILGGMGTIFGPILGAFAYEILLFVYEHATTHWPILMGLTIIVAVLVLPRGIAGVMIAPPWQRKRTTVSSNEDETKQASSASAQPATQSKGD